MPRARHTDPFTSHLAAETVVEWTALQIRIMQIFDLESKGLTDEELVKAYQRTFGISFPASESSIRSRRAELRDRGFLVDTDTTRSTKFGNKSIVWNTAERLF